MIVVVRKTLRTLMRIALAIVAVLFCAGLASTARVLGARADTVAVVVQVTVTPSIDDDASSSRSPFVRTPSSTPAEEVAAADTDLDDDDDTLSAVSHLSSLAFRAVPSPGGRSRAIRSEGEIDTSRFAAGTGLPRGPPV